MTGLPENIDRAGRAGEIVMTYALRNGTTLDGAATNLTDLLTDLMHYAALKDLDFDNCPRIASWHFDAENGRAS